jgi:hypothetical protein
MTDKLSFRLVLLVPLCGYRIVLEFAADANSSSPFRIITALAFA